MSAVDAKNPSDRWYTLPSPAAESRLDRAVKLGDIDQLLAIELANHQKSFTRSRYSEPMLLAADATLRRNGIDLNDPRYAPPEAKKGGGA